MQSARLSHVALESNKKPGTQYHFAGSGRLNKQKRDLKGNRRRNIRPARTIPPGGSRAAFLRGARLSLGFPDLFLILLARSLARSARFMLYLARTGVLCRLLRVARQSLLQCSSLRGWFSRNQRSLRSRDDAVPERNARGNFTAYEREHVCIYYTTDPRGAPQETELVYSLPVLSQ